MKLAFTSCARLQCSPVQPVWDTIRAERPDALLLLGDNVYLDRNDHRELQSLDAELAQRYAAQLAEPHFAVLRADLRARGKPLLAIYDDHDFLGDDRCGGDAPPALREAARARLVAAFDPPRTGDEVYSSSVIGPARVLMLDTRFHRRAVARTAAEPDALLGAAQWAWLQTELARGDTPFVVLASSSTFHAWRGECWEHYPAAFARLRSLLRGRAGALLLSGDIHANAMYDDSGVVEIVSSGVARRGSVFGVEHANFGLLEFDGQGVSVSLRSNKPGDRLSARIELADWRLR